MHDTGVADPGCSRLLQCRGWEVGQVLENVPLISKDLSVYVYKDVVFGTTDHHIKDTVLLESLQRDLRLASVSEEKFNSL